jgi:penicillin amidase
MTARVAPVNARAAVDDDPVTTTRDAQGIWFIEGGSLYDVYEAMGYAVAEDRLWQMDLFRRQGRGKISELLGSVSVGNDFFLRTIGYSDDEYAEMFAGISEDGQTAVTAYTDGINRRIGEFYAGDWMQMPYEYWLLGLGSVLTGPGLPVLPAPWHINDVMATMMLQLREFDVEGQISVFGHGQLDNAVLAQTLGGVYGQEGLAMFTDLRWFNDPGAQTMIPTAAKSASAPSIDLAHAKQIVSMPKIGEAADRLRARADSILRQMKELNVPIKMGSYAWAISGDRTTTGNPMLYSGPQMGFMTPSIVAEGSIRGGGMNVSGMIVPGTPGFAIGRTPHHAWSLQVGHAHTMDYYFEPPQAVFLHRMETIKVFGGDDVIVPIFRSSHGPIIDPLPYNPADPPAIIVSWAYAQWKRDAQGVDAMLGFARAESMGDFDAAVEILPFSQHLTYIDRDGNIAYWMSGYDPIRAEGVDPRLPSLGNGMMEWTGERRPRVHDENTAQGWYGGWNNKASADYNNAPNNNNYGFGPSHRAHVVEEYLSTHGNVTFEEARDLALNIATTNSLGVNGGNTWTFAGPYFKPAVEANPSADRDAAVDMIEAWDGHAVAGGPAEWRFGEFIADAWELQDAWIREVLRLTFEDEFMMAGLDYDAQSTNLTFNTLLHALAGVGASVPTLYNWFQDKSGSGKPTTPEEIIVQALDNVIADMGLGPYNTPRGYIIYNHELFGQPFFGEIWRTPLSNRSTYAQVVEFDMNGPLRIESMFPLGESGEVLPDQYGQAMFNPHFFSMIPVYDPFLHRPFPLFE